jgi:hypothetical protein
MQREMLPAGESVVSWIAYRRHGAGRNALFSHRWGLVDEVKFGCQISSLVFTSTFRATLSTRCIQIQ